MSETYITNWTCDQCDTLLVFNHGSFWCPQCNEDIDEFLCPYCGGILENPNNALEFKCSECGKETKCKLGGGSE